MPVSGNSFPVSLQFHLSGARGPSPCPQHCAPSCLPGSWLPSLFLRQHSLKISAASLLSAEERLPHYCDMLMSLASTRLSPANEAAERKLRGKITQAHCSVWRRRNKTSKKNRGALFTSAPRLPGGRGHSRVPQTGNGVPGFDWCPPSTRPLESRCCGSRVKPLYLLPSVGKGKP